MTMLSRRTFAALSLGASAAALLGKIDDAKAEGPHPLTTHLHVLYASNAKAPFIDPKITGDLTPELQSELSRRLKEPPFSAYNSYVFRDDALLQLPLGTPVSHTLPNHQVLEVRFAAVDPHSGRLTLHAEVNARTFLDVTAPPDRASMFFVAGQKFEEGILVLVFIVTPK